MTTDTLRPASDTIDASCALLAQLRTMIGDVSDEQYTAPCAAMFGSCIGSHARHALDHFRAVLCALDGATVDYDTRTRDTPIERDTGAALEEIDDLRRAISGIERDRSDDAITIRVMLSGDGARTELVSTLARELAFATHHAIHHNAMIASIAGALAIGTPEGFGKAPSTIEHEHRC